MLKAFCRQVIPVLLGLVISINHTVSATDKTQANILVLGDSLSGAYGIDRDQGWVSLLQQQLSRKGYDYRVINASVSGDTTRTALSRLEPALRTHQPAIVIVALGGNDGLRGLAFSEIQSSLASIIERSQQANARVLLAGVRLPPNYGAAYNARFAAVYRELAQRYAVSLVPQILDQVADNPGLMQSDGIHPTADAQSRIMHNVWDKLAPMLKPDR
ncbi:MAG: arylesterase [Thiohalophilus sp.]|uniref:arylesterase n=1 Tax=Thiohalophilus sp. TaxID=3028392 RepID=UPI002870130B|nr:arylesterase [Thiohalophilus sp.]MDR9435910.1 arylesterase [Thiohalophilus sp.]